MTPLRVALAVLAFSIGAAIRAADSVLPLFVSQPTAQTAVAGADAILTVALRAGVPSPTLQWFKDGVAIPGATASTLVLNAVQPRNSGVYTCVATNSSGSVATAAATFTVVPPGPASWLSNLSIRTNLGDGQTLIVGMGTTNGNKDILIRASGPSLAPFGISGMSDPKLALYKGGAKIIESDDWDASLGPTFARLGAFAFGSGSKDAAFIHSSSGPESIFVTGANAGIVLVELYDAGNGSAPRLGNLSARNRVGAGSDVLIAGFSIAGTGKKTVLIRGVGPRLADFGVSEVLSDPVLELYDSSNQKLGESDNWDPALGPTFTSVGAFALTPGSKDAAMVVTLNAGMNYSVHVKGANGGTGEALVEIYELPLQWNAAEVTYTIGNAQVAGDDMLLSFSTASELRDVTFLVDAALFGLVSVHPDILPLVQPDASYAVKLKFAIPAAKPQGLYSGKLYLVAGGRVLPQALNVSVNVAYPQIVVGPKTTVLSPQSTAMVRSISEDRSVLTFGQTTTELAALQLGNTLVLGDSPATPGGYIGRVTSVAANGAATVVTCAPESLAGAIQSARVSVSRTLTANDLVQEGESSGFVNSRGRRTPQTSAASDGFFFSLNNITLYDAGSGQKITLDGSVTVIPSFDFSFSIQDFSLQQLTFTNTSSVIAEITVNAGLSFSLKREWEFRLPVKIAPITLWAGWVPVVITPQLVLKVGIDGTVSAGMSMSATETATVSAGLNYAFGNWTPVASRTTSFTFHPPRLSAAANVKAYAGPQLDLLLYGIVGPYATVRPFVGFDAQLLRNPQYQLLAGIEAAAGVKLRVFDSLLADKEFPALIGYQVILAQGNFQKFKYTITDLGIWVQGSPMESNFPVINNIGQITFSKPGPNGSLRAVLISGGRMTDIGTLGGSSSFSYGINDAGQIVGWSHDAGGVSRAFRYSGGVMTAIAGLGGASSRATGINNAGQIVGFFTTATKSHAFRLTGAAVTDLGSIIIGGNSFAMAINNLGQAVGGAATAPLPNNVPHAFLYSGGVMSDLGTLGGSISYATSVNDLGQIVGWSDTASGAQHAFFYAGGVMTNMGHNTGAKWSIAHDINRMGQVVGHSDLGAVVFFAGTMNNLNSLVDLSSSEIGHLSVASSINDAGAIVGYGVAKNGEFRAFLLTPSPN